MTEAFVYQNIEIAILLTVLVPVIAGLLIYVLRNNKITNGLVFLTAFVLIISSLAMLFTLKAGDVTAVFIEGGETDVLGPTIPLDAIIVILDFALMLYFLYLAYSTRSPWVGIFGIIQLIAIGYVELYGKKEILEVHQNLFIDYLAVIFSLIISIIGSLICIYALKYMETFKKQPRFFAYMILFLGAMNGAVYANNVLWLFFFWEITTLCCWGLIRHEETDIAKKNAKLALEITFGGGTALAIGIFLFYQYYETLSLSEILRESGAGLEGLIFFPIALLSLAAFTKAAQVPFQSWLLGAMVAPTPVSALLHSATMVKLGVYLMIRIAPSLGNLSIDVGAFQDVPLLSAMVAVVGGFSFLTTAILAVSQNEVKRILAYSTIGNLGLIIMCVGIGGLGNTTANFIAITAAILLTLYHAISKALLFLGVGVIDREVHVKEIEGMEGLVGKMPFITYVLVGGVLTIMLIPFGMFAGKWLGFQVTLSFPLLIFFLAIGSAVTVVYYTKWLGRMLCCPQMEKLPEKERLSKLYTYPLMTMLIGAVLLSILIVPVIAHLINPAVEGCCGETPISEAEEAYYIVLIDDYGYFFVALIFIVAAIALLYPLYRISIDKAQVTTAYACGEDYDIRLGGFYFTRYFPEQKVTRFINPIASLFLIILIIFSFLHEGVGL